MTKYLSTAEAAHRLGVHSNTVHRWVRNGTLKAFRAGKLLKFREEDLDALQPATNQKPFWCVEGTFVVLRTEELGARWKPLHYELPLSDLQADPERWIKHLRVKQWWRAGMTEELRSLAAQGVK